MNPKVNLYFAKLDSWKDELTRLREISLGFDLEEEFKWFTPTYRAHGGNIFLLNRFKDYCALSFFKGALLKDAEGVLISPGENSQSVRYFRFENLDDVNRLEPLVRAYIEEAIANEKAGLKVEKPAINNLVFPDELIDKFDADPEFREAFEALTPGRQRAYNLHFTQAKQSATRASRIEKCAPKILQGKGMHD